MWLRVPRLRILLESVSDLIPNTYLGSLGAESTSTIADSCAFSATNRRPCSGNAKGHGLNDCDPLVIMVR
jgi:hypothetical protein